MYESQGAIKLINDTQTFGSGFTKREFVITTGDSKYPQDIKFEVVKDKCDLLNDFKVGQQVTVSFDIRGNEYNGKYYVNLSAWKIVAADGNNGGGNNKQKGSSHADVPLESLPTANDEISDFDDDEIPF